ncbi:hypothetical protein [Nitrosopumilus adriaticus]|uniref:hypothetical protein n=1 Tax=Nitrosopumilus adriaticus TaxID=1580092 RepID=UPI00352EA907
MSNNQNKEFQIDLFLSRIQRTQNDIQQLEHLGFSLDNLQKESKTIEILQSFPEELLKESTDMSDCYQILYCFENDLRKVINDVMYESVGINWWEQCVRPKIREDVVRNQTAEQNSVYYSRKEDPLYFTTLGDLKEIIIDNYAHFENYFRSKPFVTELLFQINRLRVAVGHNSMLEDMDIDALKQLIERWYTVK